MNKTVYILEFMRQIFVKTIDAYNSLKDQPRMSDNYNYENHYFIVNSEMETI